MIKWCSLCHHYHQPHPSSLLNVANTLWKPVWISCVHTPQVVFPLCANTHYKTSAFSIPDVTVSSRLRDITATEVSQCWRGHMMVWKVLPANSASLTCTVGKWGLQLPSLHGWPTFFALGSLIQITKVAGNQETKFLKLRKLQRDVNVMCRSISVSPGQVMKPKKVTKRQKQYVDSAMTTTHLLCFFAHIIVLKVETQNPSCY